MPGKQRMMHDSYDAIDTRIMEQTADIMLDSRLGIALANFPTADDCYSCAAENALASTLPRDFISPAHAKRLLGYAIGGGR